MSSIAFTKMHGIGNDFVVVDDFYSLSRSSEGTASRVAAGLDATLARQICDRRLGIGADQILWLKKPRDAAQADVRMEILNADGSIAEMCGNGIRAAALYFHRRAPRPQAGYRIETLAGVKTVEVRGDQVAVDMGAPRLGAGFPKAGEVLDLGDGMKLPFFEISMGNPHAVFFVQNLQTPWPGRTFEELGPRIENHPRFPERTNVEIVQVEGPGLIRVRVWERGAGITLACGTGACASAVASLATGATTRVDGGVRVLLPGGELRIRWAGERAAVVAAVIMEGPAEEVFSGEFRVIQ